MSPARYVGFAAFVVMVVSLIPKQTQRTNNVLVVAALVLAIASVWQ